MKIFIMGPQGSGKGTIGSMLSERLGLPFVSLGEVFRQVSKDNSYYEAIQTAMSSGELVPLHIAASLIKDRLSKPDCQEGFILDGWCRRMLDVNTFDPEPDVVIVLDISRETSIKRITGRRKCTSDGKTYNIYTLPKEQLKECEGELIQREDDTEEAVTRRLNIYYTETKEVIDFYRKKGLVKVIDAEGMPEEVFQNALEVLPLDLS